VSSWIPCAGGPLDRNAIEIDDLSTKTYFVLSLPDPPDEDIEAYGVGYSLAVQDMMQRRMTDIRYNLYELSCRDGKVRPIFAANGTDWDIVYDRLEASYFRGSKR
jgi:hypothetical protein